MVSLQSLTKTKLLWRLAWLLLKKSMYFQLNHAHKDITRLDSLSIYTPSTRHESLVASGEADTAYPVLELGPSSAVYSPPLACTSLPSKLR